MGANESHIDNVSPMVIVLYGPVHTDDNEQVIQRIDLRVLLFGSTRKHPGHLHRGQNLSQTGNAEHCSLHALVPNGLDGYHILSRGRHDKKPEETYHY